MSAPTEPRGDGAERNNGSSPPAPRAELLPVLAGEARVLAGEATRAPARRAPQGLLLPLVQAAAAAAGGFVAGAALAGLARRRARRATPVRSGRGARATRRSGRAPARGELVHIVGSRSLLVDVHLLGER
ncbi:MAG TPA: hypothetical protein VNZ05_00185 [Solirubrobacteraceae bacterium]|jgi:hypothetical protein|nr:hypothetical protein [Solirubrobacteraceae bacterium]